MYGIRPGAFARPTKYPSTSAPSSRPCDCEHNIETCRHCHFRTIPCRHVVSSCNPLFPLSTYTSTRPGAVLRVNTINGLLAFPHLCGIRSLRALACADDTPYFGDRASGQDARHSHEELRCEIGRGSVTLTQDHPRRRGTSVYLWVHISSLFSIA